MEMKKVKTNTEKFEKDDAFNNLLKLAPAFTTEDSGAAYPGALIEYIKKIAINAYNINNLFPEELKVPVDSLIKVCYLHQISKANMFEKNDKYDVKYGKLYKFVDNLPVLRTGELTIRICNVYGIELTEEEFTTILSIDKENDPQTKYFGSVLTFILNTANSMSSLERKKSLLK